MLLLWGCASPSSEQDQEDKETDHSNEKEQKPTEQPIDFRIVKEGLFLPWDVAWGPDNRLWITEKSMRLLRVHPDNGNASPVEIQIDGLKGGRYDQYMHGLAFHPSFAQKPYVYVSYMLIPSDDTATGSLTVTRLKYNAEQSVLKDPQRILEGQATPNSYLPGGRIMTTDEHLFICTADERKKEGVSQDTSQLNGKILRYNLDGSIPQDNPFPNSPVWSYGHRNPQGLALTGAGQLLAIEHGPESDDEINLIKKGANYGWPDVSGHCDTKKEQRICDEQHIQEPLYNWTPTIAPGTLLYYDQDKYKQWEGHLFGSTLKETDLRLLSYRDGKITPRHIYLDKKFGRIRDLCMSPSGRVFLITFNQIPANYKVNYKPSLDTSYHYEVLVEIAPDNKSS